MLQRITLPFVAMVVFSAALVGVAAPQPNEKRENFVDKIPDTDVKFEMVYVPGGEFTMGSPATEPGRDPNEGPQHRVKVNGFWMGKHEVTWDEFDKFWQDEGFLKADQDEATKLGPDAVTRPTNTFVDETYEHGREGFPVICMTHHGAMMYCNWLSAKTGKTYRLPTEAEWEYAARGGKETPYFFGSDPEKLGDYAWYKGNSPDDDHAKGTTHKVGSKQPNPFGLHDVYGNVWEWTLDQFDPTAYERFAKNPLSINPVTVPTASKWAHVVRGGSWADQPERCRSATRRISEENWQKHDPQEPRSIWWLTKMDVIGFRVVVAENETKELVGLKPRVVKK